MNTQCNFKMVSIFEVLIHVQGFLTFLQFNRLTNVNNQSRRALFLDDMPYKDRKFFIESRKMERFLMDGARISFGCNTTRIYRAYNSLMRSVPFTSEEAQIFSFDQEICRLGENTTSTSRSLISLDDVYPEYGVALIDTTLLEYKKEGVEEVQYLRGKGKVERFM
jgi:hypothetical protein